jgi:RimJ/RimL family protein N-acetyltransferase
MLVQTERLLLRHFTEADAEHLLLMEQEPDVLRHVGRKPLVDVAAYREKIRSVFLPYYVRPDGFGPWAIVEKGSGEFIGGCSLRPGTDSDIAVAMDYVPSDVEMGYGLRKQSWGRGYATEIAQTLVRMAFMDLGVESLVATVSVGNLGSIRVVEKAGLRRIGLPTTLPGEEEPSVKYRLTKDEWRSCR